MVKQQHLGSTISLYERQEVDDMSPDRSQQRSTALVRPRRRATWPVQLPANWRDEIDFMLLSALLILVALGGGSAFADTVSLLYVRLAAVVTIVAFLLTPARPDWHTYRAPILMLAVLAAIVAAQLVPLPPSIWETLPGREPYLEAARALGIQQPWRPLSLTPDLTANSLVTLIVPAAVLLGITKLGAHQRGRLLPAFIILCSVSMVVGILQLGSGHQSALYWYRRTYPGTAVGLLANRNHQAAMLAVLFTALYAWNQQPQRDRTWMRWRTGIATSLGISVIPVLLATGSRAGILLAPFSIAVAIFAFPLKRSRTGAIVKNSRLIRTGVISLLVIIAIATWRFGRALSIQRLLGGAPNVEDDLRFRYAPLVWDIIRKTFPAGTGFGSFDPIFRQYEPDAILKNTYFNHAHNELLELVMTAGLAGVVLLGVFLSWCTIRFVAAIRDRGDKRRYQDAMLGLTMIAVFLLASLVDYPLRTPLLQSWFAIACGWLCTARQVQRSEDG